MKLLLFFTLLFGVQVSVFAGSLPASFTKRVLIEDATGTWCGYCPGALQYINEISEELGEDNIIVLANHSGDIMETTDGDKLITAIGGVTGYPNCAIDRVPYSSSTTAFGSRSYIKPASRKRVALTPECGLTIDATATDDTVRVYAGFLNNISGDVRVSVILLEDGIVASQSNYMNSDATSDYYGLGSKIADFVHDDVIRDILSDDVVGDVVSATKGNIQEFKFVPNYSGFVKANCKIVATINVNGTSAATHEVLNALEAEVGEKVGWYTPSSTVDPVITNKPDTEVEAGSKYSYVPVVTDNGTSFSFSITNKPSWATFNNKTGALTGTPDNGDVNSYSDIKITVTDEENLTGSTEVFSITVEAVNVAPVISGTPETTVIEDEYYAFKPTVTDDGGNLTFSITNKPSWAGFSTRTGQVSGTPENKHIGSYNDITITVTDDGGLTAVTTPFSIVVEKANDAPEISGTPIASIIENEAYSFIPTVTDDGTDFTFSIENKPSWATFNTNSGELSGTPVKTDIGTYSDIAITVTDDGGLTDVTTSFDIEVTVTTGVKNFINVEGYAITVAPNPVVNNVSIFTRVLDQQDATVSIINMAGNEVLNFQTTLESDVITSDFTKLPQGSYIVILSVEGEKKAKQIIYKK